MSEKLTPEAIAEVIVDDARDMWYTNDHVEWEVNFERLKTLIRDGIKKGIQDAEVKQPNDGHMSL